MSIDCWFATTTRSFARVGQPLGRTDIQIVGEAANGKDALRLAKKEKPDVILLDIACRTAMALAHSKNSALRCGEQSRDAVYL